QAKKDYKEVIVAYDALTVIVNPKNPISKLTREQLEDIFTGKITNWKEVGGKDQKIIVYSRETSSGTYEFFKESVLNKKNYKTSVLSLPATGAIVQSISQTEGAIGYIGLAYLDKNIKGLQVSYDQGKTYITPSFANAKNRIYPIVRPLYYYYLSAKEKKVKPFIDFVLGVNGQKIISAIGYIPVK
ncbi:MAG: phosphate ABC transporter substrate-binding protein, partial [Bacteroidales bacterium]